MTPDAAPEEPKLYVVYLGGDPAPGRLSEDHETVVVVASDVAGARAAARAKWAGATKPHVDALQHVDVIDGFRVRLEQTDTSSSSYVDVTYVPSDD